MRVMVLIAGLLLAGCARSQLQPAMRPPVQGWALTFTAAQRWAEAGDYVRADTLLASYARDNPGTPEALEAVFWRGVYALDPSNPNRSTAMAAGAFDEYLRGGMMLMRRGEALVLRRVALGIEGAERLATPLAARASSARDTARRDTTARDSTARDPRDAEIARLREELKRATEELERIKRRIATPTRPDPPPPVP